MSINKNFVIKNGIVVKTDLIVGDETVSRVGIGTTRPLHKLHVNGGIGATTLTVAGLSTFRNGPVLIGSATSTGTSNQSLQVTGSGYISGNLGIGVTNSSVALYVVGDTVITGISTIPTINSTTGTIDTLSGTTASYATANVTTGNIVTGIVTNVQGTNLNYSGIGTVNSLNIGATQVISSGRQLQNISSLDATTTATIETAIANGPNTFTDLKVTGISTLNQVTASSLNVTGLTTATTLIGTNINYSGIGTITTLNSTTGTITSLTGTTASYSTANLTTGNIVTGIITNAQGTNINYSGIGTITTLNSTTGTVTNLSGTNVNYSGIGTITTLNTTTGTVTNLSGTNVNYSGIGTITTLNSTTGTVTNLSATNLSGTNVNYSGIGTIATLNTTTGTVTNLSGTNINYSGIGTIATLNTTTGTVTNLSGTNINYSGIGTITTLNSTVATATNLSGTNINYSGIGTIATLNTTTGTVTNLSGTNINYSGIGTVNSLNINATQVISSGRQLQNIASLDATTTATIESAIAAAPNNFNDLNVAGISTLGTVRISSGIITATSGIVTYYGDGQYLTNVTRGVGIQTAGSGGPIGLGATILDFRGPGISTVTVGSGIGTINITGGISIAVTSVAPATPSIGNLWFNVDLARTFIYYDEVALGLGTDKYWIDASPFNVGIITALSNISFANGTASSPSWYFENSSTTGVFSESVGTISFVSVGSTILNINPSGIVVSGITTSTDFNALSDVRYKEDINTVESALETVDQLRGVKFTWKESGLPSYGVIAQELEEVLPELVHGHDPKTVNYNGIIGVLIEAIKELKAEVEELKKS